jgi:Holliday junction resolvasome RuvABC DNA-binding subunit
MIVELRDKVAALARELPAGPGVPAATDDELVAALVNLGYKPSQAQGAVTEARKGAPQAAFHELLRTALRRLSRA